MKKLIQALPVLLCLSISTQLSAQSDEMKNLQSEKRSQIPDLHSMLYQHFNEKGALTPDGSLSLAAFKDKTRQDRLYQIDRVLALAIDEDYSLGDLEEFGVTRVKEGRYEINLKDNPMWAIPSSFYIDSTQGLSESSAIELKKLGFTSDDISRLDTYLNQHPNNIEILEAQTRFIKQQTQKLSRNYSIVPVSLAESSKMLTQRNQVQYETQRDWLFAIFNLFGKRKQRILLSYLQDQLNIKILMKYPRTEYSLINFANDIITGQALKNIQASLHSQKKGIIK
ncbi:MAG: hypothetical protein ACI8WB_001847 [Phenylobacterium sp.]|jgi:hypothetical protein